MGGFVPLSSLKLHLIWGDRGEHPTFTHTWTLKSPLWSHTYFLEFSQAICGQREDACIETHVSRLTYAHLKWFLTVPSSYILLLLCRTQGCRESWKSEQISQVGLIHLSFWLLSSPDWKAATESETSSSAGSFIVWFRRVLDVPVRRVCHRFLYQRYHHMLQKNRRFWYHCPTHVWGTQTCPYSARQSISLSPVTLVWLLLSSGLDTHILTHASFYEWECSYFMTKHLKVVKGINLLQLCNPKRWVKRLQQCYRQTRPLRFTFGLKILRFLVWLTVLKCKSKLENVFTETRKTHLRCRYHYEIPQVPNALKGVLLKWSQTLKFTFSSSFWWHRSFV